MAVTATAPVTGAGSFDPAPARDARPHPAAPAARRLPLRVAVGGLLRRDLRLPARLRRCGCRSTTTSSPPRVRRSTGRSSGSTTTWNALTDDKVQQSFRNVVVFLVINVPLTVVLAIASGDRAERRHPVPRLLPHRLLRAVRHGERGDDRGVAVAVQQRRPRQQRSSARSRPTRRGSSTRRWRCRRSRSTSPGSSSGSTSCSTSPRCRTSPRSSTRRRRGRGRPLGQVPQRHLAGRTPGDHAGRRPGDHHRIQPVHRAVPADRRRRAQRGLVVSGARSCTRRGIEQGDAGYAAAIGVILVIFVGHRRARWPGT